MGEPTNGRDTAVWSDADADPKLIRSYHHPVDGWYLLGADVVAWLRDLAAAARDANAVAEVFHAPFLDRMAETAERLLTDSAEKENDRG